MAYGFGTARVRRRIPDAKTAQAQGSGRGIAEDAGLGHDTQSKRRGRPDPRNQGCRNAWSAARRHGTRPRGRGGVQPPPRRSWCP